MCVCVFVLLLRAVVAVPRDRSISEFLCCDVGGAFTFEVCNLLKGATF